MLVPAPEAQPGCRFTEEKAGAPAGSRGGKRFTTDDVRAAVDWAGGVVRPALRKQPNNGALTQQPGLMDQLPQASI